MGRWGWRASEVVDRGARGDVWLVFDFYAWGRGDFGDGGWSVVRGGCGTSGSTLAARGLPAQEAAADFFYGGGAGNVN